MGKFIFEGPKNPQQATSAIVFPDGRSAAVGEEIELSESEVSALRKENNLSEVRSESAVTPNVTESSLLASQSGTLNNVPQEVSENNQ